MDDTRSLVAIERCYCTSISTLYTSRNQHTGEYFMIVKQPLSPRDVAQWEERLPGIVEAIVFVGEEDRARSVHRDFLEHYQLNSAQVPLVRYVVGSHFEVVSN